MVAREVWGPSALDAPATTTLVRVRRYRCLICRTVGPKDVLPRKRYRGSAILFALALWSVGGLSASEVRSRVSPWRHVGATASLEGWPSLKRWVKHGSLELVVHRPAVAGTYREQARRVVTAAVAGRTGGWIGPVTPEAAFVEIHQGSNGAAIG